MKDFLNAGYGVGLSLTKVTDPARDLKVGHAVTCWGYEYLGNSASGYLGLWITDSDDNMGAPAANQLRYYHLKKTGNRWYLQDYAGRSDWQLAGVIGMARRPAGTLIPATLLQSAGNAADAAPTLDGGSRAAAVSSVDPDLRGSLPFDRLGMAQEIGLANGIDGEATELSRGVPRVRSLAVAAGERVERDTGDCASVRTDLARAVRKSWWDGARGTRQRVQDYALLDLLSDDGLSGPLWL